MPNTHVYSGADGSLTLSTPPENGRTDGTRAQQVIDQYQMLSVGRVQNVRVEVHSDVKAFHEIGQRYASELRPGNVTIRGTIGRAYINGAMLKLMMGDAADKHPGISWTQPSFNITLLLENSATPDIRNTLTLHDVKIENWAYTMPEDEFLLEAVGFQALFLSVADEG